MAEYTRDESLTLPIMVNGVGMPYVAIFNIDGYPIIDPLTGLPVGCGITRFTFKSQVDEPNETSITIMTGSSAIADSPQLQEGYLIVVQWGYIFPKGNTISSKPKPLRIKEIDYTFDNNGTTVVLKCEDQSGEIRFLPQYIPDPTTNETFTDYMDRGFDQEIGILIQKHIPDESTE